MDEGRPNRDLIDMEDYVGRHGGGKKAKERLGRVLSSLGKDEQSINAIQSPVGTELLSYMAGRMEVILDKIINETADEKEMADFRAYKDLSQWVIDKIKSYEKNLTELKEK